MFELPHSTINDIAVLARTSKENVARVMLGKSGVPIETQQRITQAIKILSRPDNDKSLEDVYGVVLIEHLNHNDYMGYIAQGIANSAEKHGLRIMLHVLSHEYEYEANYFELLRRNHLANGFIVILPYDYRPLLDYCETHHIPTVLVDRYTGQSTKSISVVESDNYGGARMAVEHLIALGHRRIAHITGPVHIRGAAERVRGYQDTLAEADIPFERALMLEGNFDRNIGRIQARALLSLPKPPTAIFAASDHMAHGALSVARELGLTVGHDISVIGFDDLAIAAEMKPPLTTVHQPMIEMGECAGDMMANMMHTKQNVSEYRLFPTQLIVRNSTGKPARS